MVDFVSSRVGQVDNAGAVDALFLKTFSGEVMTAFKENNVMLPLHMVRTAKNRKGSQFPCSGRVAAYYHTPGNQLDFQTVAHGERVLTPDDLLVSPVFIPDIDEAMNHYEYRSIYSAETGQVLSDKMDQNILRVAVLSARSAANLSELPGGTALTDADFDTSSTSMVSTLFQATTQMEVNRVPQTGRYAILRPAQYFLLIQDDKIGAKEFTDGQTNLNSARINTLARLTVVMSNNVPSADDSANTAIPSAYRADFSTTQAAVFQKSAFGTVKLMDLETQSWYDGNHQGQVINSRYSVGHGVLRPECAFEIKTA